MAQNTTSICLCTNGECRAIEFVEEDKLCFNNDGSVHYVQFIEGDSSIRMDATAFYAKELLERFIIYLTDESDVYLVDELGNRLTALI